MPEANWACPICQAAHLAIFDKDTLPGDIIVTHRLEHYGPGGSTASVVKLVDGRWAVQRAGNGNRWANRESFNPQPKADESMVKLEDFLAGVIGAEAMGEDPGACDAGSCDCDNRTDVYGSEEPDTPCDPKPLVGPDVCRVCWHGPHRGTAACSAVDPVDINPYQHSCGCTEYVDEEAEGRITVPPIGDAPGEERITDEAWRLVMGDRQSSYNHPARDFEATGRMWAAILTNWLDLDEPMPDVEPRIVALMIAMVKVSRESHKHKHDNLVDLIGYALCADRVVRGY
jgi:hypothetical protein